MDSVIKKTGFFKSFDGADVYYESRGAGESMILCYGIGCLMNHWTEQVKHFSKTHLVSMLDYRGHHKTPVPDNKESLSIESLAMDVIHYCEINNISSADFVGHSFGCQVMLAAFQKKPELFKTMTFVNGLHKNPFDHLMAADDLVELVNQAKKLYNQAPGVISALWEKGVTNPLLVPLSSIAGGFNLSKTALKDIEIYARGVSAIDLRVFLTFFEDMVAFNAEDTLSKIKIPTLIICGSKDALTPIDEQEKMHELIASSELYPVPYGSHCTQLDFPEMVNLKIQNFIGQAKSHRLEQENQNL